MTSHPQTQVLNHPVGSLEEPRRLLELDLCKRGVVRVLDRDRSERLSLARVGRQRVSRRLTKRVPGQHPKIGTAGDGLLGEEEGRCRVGGRQSGERSSRRVRDVGWHCRVLQGELRQRVNTLGRAQEDEHRWPAKRERRQSQIGSCGELQGTASRSDRLTDRVLSGLRPARLSLTGPVLIVRQAVPLESSPRNEGER